MNLSQVKGRHSFWWKHLVEKAGHSLPINFDVEMPSCVFLDKGKRIAGSANRRECTYNLQYALSEDDVYDVTICHEICHTFDLRMNLCAFNQYEDNYSHDAHGSFWRYLFNVICNQKRGRYHAYDHPDESVHTTLKQLKQLKRLQRKAAELGKEAIN